jgi:hypothetical protein
MPIPINFTYPRAGAAAPVDQAYGTYISFAEVPTSGQYPTTQKITVKALWGDSTGELLSFYTSSLQTSTTKQYYYEVWSSSSLTCDAEDIKMFSISYGNINGSGSLLSSGGESGDTPSRAIYGQYRSLSLENDPTQSYAVGAPSTFKLSDGKEITQFYAVNFNRARIGDKLDPGNFELNIAELNGGAYGNNVFTGSNVAVSSSNKIISLIDDTSDVNDSFGYLGMSSPIRNLVSGTIAGGVYNPSTPHYYGLVYLDQGTIIIDADKLNVSSSFNTVSGSNINGDNSYKLFTAISGAAVQGNGFFARSVNISECAYYYIRVYPVTANYSNNPTFVSSSRNTIRNKTFRNDPTVYVTSIGLYNDQLELLAVAKMSKPIRKDYNTELSVTVKLEY